MMLDDGSGLRDTPLAKLAGLAHDRLGEMSDVQDARGLAGLTARFAQPPRQTGWRLSRRSMLLAGAVAAASVVAALGPSLLRKSPLTYVMRGGEIQAGGYFRIGEQAQPIIRFSDGSRLDLMAGARGRVATVDAHGARVMLDDGEAYVDVVPREGARWLFDAGPFLVRVQGTEFTLAWKADEGRLDLRLQKGAVSVTGPVSEQAIALRAGQWLTVRLSTHEVFVRNLDSEPPASSGPAVAPSPASRPTAAPPVPEPVQPSSRARQRHPARSAPPKDFDWASARADGDWERILDHATGRGLARTLAERSSEDLALLADAAHYLGHDDIAERVLLAQRQRFPGSTRAKDAAFLLGRIVEARPGGAMQALGWYDRHLEEAPTGVYASEALGRKMTVLARLQGERAARPVAREYLRRYPGGTYARAARAYARKP
jgi:TolA-binding protein